MASAGQGSNVYAPQINYDSRSFPNFDGLPQQWSSGAECITLFANLLPSVNHDGCFGIINEPYGPMIPSNILKPIMRKTRQQNRLLPIYVPPMPACGALFLSKMRLFLRACKKALIPANMMAANPQP